MRLAWCLPSRWILDASWEEKKWWYPPTVQDRTRQWWFPSGICFFGLFCSPCMLSLMIVVFCFCAVRTSIDRIGSQYRKILSIHQANTVFHMNHWHDDTVNGRNPAPVDMVNITYFTRFYTSQVGAGFLSTGAGFLPSTVWEFLSILVTAPTFSTGAFPGVRKALVARGVAWDEMNHSIWPL